MRLPLLRSLDLKQGVPEISAVICFLMLMGLVTVPVNGQDQTFTRSFDYAHNPRLNYDFKELRLELNIEPDPLHLEGIAEYTVAARIDSLETLVLLARRLDIQQVNVNNEETEFTIEGDTLRIDFSEPMERETSFPVTIRYRANPDFGLLRDTSGTVWTSRLPLSNANWLPVLDHPRVMFQTDLRISVPSTYKVMANGSFAGEEVVSVDKKQFRFKSDRPIPASDLAFAAGPFVEEEISFGNKTIRGYFLADQRSAEQRNDLMDTAYTTLKQTEKRVRREYPFSAFQFAVLPDHHWETKSYASSLTFLYGNKSSKTEQLKRGIYAQWFGAYQREEQWTDAESMLLYQGWLFTREAVDQKNRQQQKDQPDITKYHFYNVFSHQHWDRWRQFFQQSDNHTFKKVIRRTVDRVLGQGNGVYNWDDYARTWYQYSGQPWFEIPSLPNFDQPDSSRYRVVTHYNPQQEGLTLSFTALQNPLKELVSLPMIMHRSDTTLRQAVMFTGKKDSVVFNTSGKLQNVEIEMDTVLPLELDVRKPKSFWIHQLRSGDTEEERMQAARGLKAYSGEPDLQLLLNQVLKQDSSALVQAAVYATLAEVLQGASGTEQTFLDALQSGHWRIQVEALQALTHYDETDRVKRAIREFALQTESPRLIRQAIRSYSNLVENEEFATFAGDFVKNDTTARGIPVLLEQWLEKNGEEQALKAALSYTGDEYSYRTRIRMIRLLTREGSGFEGWENKIPELLQDLDPRIRYLTIEALKLLPDSKAQSIAKKQQSLEYDARIVEKLNTFIH